MTRLAVLLLSILGLAHASSADDLLEPVLGVQRSAVIGRGDTLLDLAERNRLGFGQVVGLNPGVDVWLPPVGTNVQLPTEYILPRVERDGLVINLPEMRIYDFGADRGSPPVLAIAIGDVEDQTPVGEFRVGNKRLDPYWYVPDSIREENPNLPSVVPPGPENPLGDRWLTLGHSSYGIHGTNNVWSIGRLSTHGCIRLYNEDMRALYERTKVGARVRIVYQPVKLGIRRGVLYLEAHPDAYGLAPDVVSATLVELIALDALGVVDGLSIDEDRVRRIISEARGAPVPIGRLKTDE